METTETPAEIMRRDKQALTKNDVVELWKSRYEAAYDDDARKGETIAQLLAALEATRDALVLLWGEDVYRCQPIAKQAEAAIKAAREG